MGLVKEFADAEGAGLVALSAFSEEDVALVVVGGRRKRGWEGERQGGGVERPRRGTWGKAAGGTARVRLGEELQYGLGASALG